MSFILPLRSLLPRVTRVCDSSAAPSSPSHRRAYARTALRTLLGPALLPLIISGSAMPVRAHDTPAPDWCITAEAVVSEIGRFDFSGAELRAYVARNEVIMKSCGAVDHPDEWKCSHDIATQYCATLSDAIGITKFDQPAKAVIVGPSSARTDNHHQIYHLDHGLFGACVVCQTP